jgi:DUF1009 family protein
LTSFALAVTGRCVCPVTAPDTAPPKLGIIAGGGALPLRIAEACEAEARPFHVIALEGFAEAGEIERFPHDWSAVGTVQRTMEALRRAGCRDVVLVGIVRRPNFSALKLDVRGARLLPKVIRAAGQGDDAILKVLVADFEEAGFRVVGADDITAHLLAPEGAFGRHAPTARDRADIEKAARVVAALGPFDVGQGAVVCEGLVLAIEAAEGTDAMLARCAGLPEPLRGTAGARRGVLVKRPKPGQERRVDLPVIGVETVTRAADAGLAGIAVAAGGSLVMGREAVAAEADRLGLFVTGQKFDGDV